MIEIRNSRKLFAIPSLARNVLIRVMLTDTPFRVAPNVKYSAIGVSFALFLVEIIANLAPLIGIAATCLATDQSQSYELSGL